MSDAQWKILKQATIGLVISVTLSLVLILVFLDKFQTASDEYALQLAALNAIEQRNRKAGKDFEIYQLYLARFHQLQTLGILGEEHRVNWVNTLRRSAERLKVKRLQYRVLQRQSYSPKFIMEQQRYLYMSPMYLQMQLYHEGDLLTILDDLQREAQGLFYVEKCEVSRTVEALDLTLKTSNFSVACELHWLTLNRDVGLQSVDI